MAASFADAASRSRAIVEARTSGISTGMSRNASVSAGSPATPVCTLDITPPSKSALCAIVTPRRQSSGASASALKPVTTWMRATPAPLRLATTQPITVSSPNGSSGLNSPMRDDRPAASTIAATAERKARPGMGSVLLPPCRRGPFRVHPVLLQDLFDLQPAVEDHAGAALGLEGRVETDHVLAIDPAIFFRHRALEPAGELFDHHVEARIHGLALVGAAAVEAEDAAPAGQAAAIESAAHADGKAGHRAHEVGIVSAHGFERQLCQNVAAGVALEHELRDAEGFVSHGEPFRNDQPASMRR